MKLNYKSYLLILTALMAGGCSDSNKWEPGPEVEQTMGVYFDALSSYDYMFTPGDDMTLSFKVSRINPEEAATVPLKVLSVPEGVVVPPEVTFTAGQETAEVMVDLSGMPIKTSDDIRLQIDPAYSNIYSAGTTTLTLGVTYSDWKIFADNVAVQYTDYSGVDIFPGTTTQLRVLEGTNKMKISNFMDSGVDLFFTIKNTAYKYPSIVPFKNVEWVDGYDPNDKDITDWEMYDWYFYDAVNGKWPKWHIGDSETLIEYAEFFGDGYCYIGIDEGWASFCGSICIGNDEWIGAYVNLTFEAIFNPLEK